MSEQRSPVQRIEFYEKATKKKYRIATVWPGRTPFSDDVQFEKASTNAKYPTLTIAEALRMSDAREGFIQISKVKSAKERNIEDAMKSARPADDSDIPF